MALLWSGTPSSVVDLHQFLPRRISFVVCLYAIDAQGYRRICVRCVFNDHAVWTPVNIIDWQGGNASYPTNWNLAANWNPNTAVPNGPLVNVRFGISRADKTLVDNDFTRANCRMRNVCLPQRAPQSEHRRMSLRLIIMDVSSSDVAGTHTISAPVILINDATISGGGTLNLTGGISGNHTLTVLGNLTATSIQVDTLTIGGAGATAVPEPTLLVLFGIGAVGFSVFRWRRGDPLTTDYSVPALILFFACNLPDAELITRQAAYENASPISLGRELPHFGGGWPSSDIQLFRCDDLDW